MPVRHIKTQFTACVEKKKTGNHPKTFLFLGLAPFCSCHINSFKPCTGQSVSTQVTETGTGTHRYDEVFVLGEDFLLLCRVIRVTGLLGQRHQHLSFQIHTQLGAQVHFMCLGTQQHLQCWYYLGQSIQSRSTSCIWAHSNTYCWH